MTRSSSFCSICRQKLLFAANPRLKRNTNSYGLTLSAVTAACALFGSSFRTRYIDRANGSAYANRAGLLIRVEMLLNRTAMHLVYHFDGMYDRNKLRDIVISHDDNRVAHDW